MPKGKQQQHGGGACKKKQRAVRAAYRKERKSGAYLNPGDPDFKSFSNQLAVQGLRLRDVAGDGNCLFRALALQLKDRLSDHHQLRRDVVQYMREHRDEFEPFLEDQTPFEQYLGELAREGEYAGNDAIVAFARAHSTNVVIHQHNAPRWEVLTPACRGSTHTLHIAYLNGEHYCSVESLLPSETLPSIPTKITKTVPYSPVRGGSSQEARTVLEATGCQDLELVEQSLCENSYDPQLAIVEVLQLMNLSESGGCDASNETHKPAPQSPVDDLPAKQVDPKRKSQPQASQRRLSNKERKAAAKVSRKQANKRGDAKRDTIGVPPAADPVGSTPI